MELKPHTSKFVFCLLIFSNIIWAEDNILQQNFDIESKTNQIAEEKLYKKKVKSAFYPEFNIVTGLGSEFTKDKSETDRGGVLYFDSKINLYNGSNDLNELGISNQKILKASSEKEFETRKLKSNIFKTLLEIKNSKLAMNMLKEEIISNKSQSLWAKKKVDAGLTTNAELLDFQIKENNLENEISSLEIEIKEKETEILKSFNHKFSIEEIEKQISETELKTNSTENTLEQKMLTQELKIADLELKKAQGSYLPKLDLEAKVGNITPTSHLLKAKAEHQVALTLTIPLFSGFSSQADVQKSLISKSQKESILRNYQSNLNANKEVALKKIELSKKLLENFKLQLEKALKFNQQTTNEYKRGIKNSSDLIASSDRVLEFKRKINDLEVSFKIETFNFNSIYSE